MIRDSFFSLFEGHLLFIESCFQAAVSLGVIVKQMAG